MKISKIHLMFVIAALAASAAAEGGRRVIDGDTIEVAGETIRILNIDTPEIHLAKCQSERRRGLVAKNRLDALISGRRLAIKRGDHGRMTDRNGRTLALVFVDGRDVGEILIAEGLARRWDGRRRPWCD